MALSTPFVGSGRFVPVRVWSCSRHEGPETHECECDRCELPYYLCEECESASWVDEVGPDGEPVLRELASFEALLFDGPVHDLFPGSLFAAAAQGLARPYVEWVEDVFGRG